MKIKQEQLQKNSKNIIQLLQTLIIAKLLKDLMRT
jgi:hypothetical protein